MLYRKTPYYINGIAGSPQAQHRQSGECEVIDESNVQQCWELWVERYLGNIDTQYVNSQLASLDLNLIVHLTELQVSNGFFFICLFVSKLLHFYSEMIYF